MIILEKARYDVQWADLRLKTTQETYNELERYEKQYQPVTPEHLSSVFGTTSPVPCSHQNHHDNHSSISSVQEKDEKE